MSAGAVRLARWLTLVSFLLLFIATPTGHKVGPIPAAALVVALAVWGWRRDRRRRRAEPLPAAADGYDAAYLAAEYEAVLARVLWACGASGMKPRQLVTASKAWDVRHRTRLRLLANRLALYENRDAPAATAWFMALVDAFDHDEAPPRRRRIARGRGGEAAPRPLQLVGADVDD